MVRPHARAFANDDGLLDWMESQLHPDYKRSELLKSEFSSDVWDLQIGERSIHLDFRIRLDDHSLLTEEKNTDLLTIFKCWICVQTHPDATGGEILAPRSALSRISKTLRLIDYFLLRAAHFQLGEFGLSLVTESDLRALLTDLAKNAISDESIYEATDRFRNFLSTASSQLTAAQIESAKREQPLVAQISIPSSDRILFKDDDELIRVRAYLWVNSYYGKPKQISGYRYVASLDKAIAKIYPNTLWARNSIRVRPPELHFDTADRYRRELDAAPVKGSRNITMSAQHLSQWHGVLRNLALLAQMDLPIPIEALNEVSQLGFIDRKSLTPVGRFHNLPTTWVIKALQHSIEFSLEYGKDLLESYFNIAMAARKARLSISELASRSSISQYLTPKIRDMGVAHWHLAHQMANVEAGDKRVIRERAPSSDYFVRFRNNEGLLELIRVLYGSVQICVGIVSARRVSEIAFLAPGQALDSTRRHLIFKNMKTGAAGFQNQIARPIPPVVDILFRMLEEFHHRLNKWGLVKETPYIFGCPTRNECTLTNSYGVYTACLDSFSDYFCAPVDDRGRRHYARQHQLRRSFAMLFFWGNKFAGVETLQWFLGHVDPEHLYRYITESIPGEVLERVKASYGAEVIKTAPSAASSLAELVGIHFGTNNYSVLDSHELEEYIYDLLEDGVVTIEPHFFQTPNGKRYKVIVRVERKSNDDRPSTN